MLDSTTPKSGLAQASGAAGDLSRSTAGFVKKPSSDPANERRAANISFVLFIAGGVVGVYNMATSVVPFGEGFEMVALATNLAHHGVFGNPFLSLATGPTAANPPLYPFLLALIMAIFRIPAAILFAATLCNVFANALTAAWLPRVSNLMYGDIRPGIVASVLWLLSAPLNPSWDTSYTVAGLLLFCLFSSSGIAKERPLFHGASAGLIAGVLFLLNPSVVLIFLPWLAWLAWAQRTALSRTVLYCGALLAVLFLVAFSWAFRNDRQLGSFVIRTNLGMTLYASNNDCARASLIDEELNHCYQSHHPNMSLEEATILQRLGEPAYDRLRKQDTKAWIQAHPASFLRLTEARMRDFWFPPAQGHPFKSAAIWLATLLAVPGLVLMIVRKERVVWFPVVVLLVYPLMYYIVVSDVRYRLPVLWLSLLPAGYFLTSVARRRLPS
jgi:hypothetical protein